MSTNLKQTPVVGDSASAEQIWRSLSTPQCFLSPYVTKEQLLKLIAETGLGDNKLVANALASAEEAHRHQRRDDGSPYLEQHVYAVAYEGILSEMAAGRRVQAKFVAMLLLHDVLEDYKELSRTDFDAKWGHSTEFQLKPRRSVAELVAPLTKGNWEEFPGATVAEKKEARDRQYHEGLETAEYESRLGKVADRWNNIACSHRTNLSKLKEYLEETRNVYLEMAREISPHYFYPKLQERLGLLEEIVRLVDEKPSTDSSAQ